MKQSAIACATFLLILTAACQATKKTSHVDSNSPASPASERMFDCYQASDTTDHLVLFFPEENMFYVNSLPCTKEEVCQRIQYDISRNKGVYHYYAPESNFMFMMSIVREVKNCYLKQIDQLAQRQYSLPYEQLSTEQKMIIDSTLSYCVLSE